MWQSQTKGLFSRTTVRFCSFSSVLADKFFGTGGKTNPVIWLYVKSTVSRSELNACRSRDDNIDIWLWLKSKIDKEIKLKSSNTSVMELFERLSSFSWYNDWNGVARSL